jgi:hypothetical protein
VGSASIGQCPAHSWKPLLQTTLQAVPSHETVPFEMGGHERQLGPQWPVSFSVQHMSMPHACWPGGHVDEVPHTPATHVAIVPLAPAGHGVQREPHVAGESLLTQI